MIFLAGRDFERVLFLYRARLLASISSTFCSSVQCSNVEGIVGVVVIIYYVSLSCLLFDYLVYLLACFVWLWCLRYCADILAENRRFMRRYRVKGQSGYMCLGAYKARV